MTAARRSDLAPAMLRAGANHVILGIPGAAAPDVLAAMAREVAVPPQGIRRRRRVTH